MSLEEIINTYGEVDYYDNYTGYIYKINKFINNLRHHKFAKCEVLNGLTGELVGYANINIPEINDTINKINYIEYDSFKGFPYNKYIGKELFFRKVSMKIIDVTEENKVRLIFDNLESSWGFQNGKELYLPTAYLADIVSNDEIFIRNY